MMCELFIDDRSVGYVKAISFLDQSVSQLDDELKFLSRATLNFIGSIDFINTFKTGKSKKWNQRRIKKRMKRFFKIKH